ncbi:MAG: hypothetical protein AAF483_04655 [Planctomycetota bacterium]
MKTAIESESKSMFRLGQVLFLLPAIIAVSLAGCTKPQPTALILLDQSKSLGQSDTDAESIDLVEIAFSEEVMTRVASRCKALHAGKEVADIQSHLKNHLKIEPNESESNMFTLTSSEENQVLGCVTLMVWSDELDRKLDASTLGGALLSEGLQILEQQASALEEKARDSLGEATSNFTLPRLTESINRLRGLQNELQSLRDKSNIDFAQLSQDINKLKGDASKSEDVNKADRLDAIQSLIRQAIHTASSKPPAGAANFESELLLLKTQLAEALAQYGENHPRVLQLKKQIEALEKEGTALVAGNSAPQDSNSESQQDVLDYLSNEIGQAESFLDKIKNQVSDAAQNTDLASKMRNKLGSLIGQAAGTSNAARARVVLVKAPETTSATKEQFAAYLEIQQQSGGTLPAFEQKRAK